MTEQRMLDLIGGAGCVRRPEVCDLHGVPEDDCACNNP